MLPNHQLSNNGIKLKVKLPALQYFSILYATFSGSNDLILKSLGDY